MSTSEELYESGDDEDDENSDADPPERRALGFAPRTTPRYLKLQKNISEFLAGGFQSARQDRPRGISGRRSRTTMRTHTPTASPEPGEATTYAEWKQGIQRAVVVEGGSLGRSESTFTFQDVRLQETFRAQGLQVIPKIASIELTSGEAATYEGGSWHLEGMLNEYIVATAIYYFDVENVTESTLTFRQKAVLDDMELEYEQDQP